MVPKNKPCKRNNRQISDNTKIAAKQGNAEERPDAGCEIKRWKTAAEMQPLLSFIISWQKMEIEKDLKYSEKKYYVYFCKK